MRKNITTSSFKRIPAAFLIAATLFLLTEWFIYANRAELIEDYWNKFLINERALLDLPENYKYLIVGDSIQKTGINPTAVNKEILNLGLPGGKPMSLYLLLKRYLKRHNPPEAVFLYIDPEDPHDSLFTILRYFVSIPEFISIWNDLTWKERRVFITRYWASLDLRKVGLTVRDKYPYSNKVFVEKMIKNHGFMPAPSAGNAISGDYFATHTGRIQDGISISARDTEYLDKLMKLASSKNIKVIFLGFLLPEELYGIFEKNNFDNDYRKFFRRLKIRYPRSLFVRKPILYLKNSYFGDPSHVNKEGSEIYTEYFKKMAFAPYFVKTEKK
ncbi:MAG: hypothetical protein WBC74_04045 [Candidatus Omnitrophota bacterium]